MNWTANSKNIVGDGNVRMIRIINGTLYHDWPWGMKRFDATPDYYSMRLIAV